MAKLDLWLGLLLIAFFVCLNCCGTAFAKDPSLPERSPFILSASELARGRTLTVTLLFDRFDVGAVAWKLQVPDHLDRVGEVFRGATDPQGVTVEMNSVGVYQITVLEFDFSGRVLQASQRQIKIISPIEGLWSFLAVLMGAFVSIATILIKEFIEYLVSGWRQYSVIRELCSDELELRIAEMKQGDPGRRVGENRLVEFDWGGSGAMLWRRWLRSRVVKIDTVLAKYRSGGLALDEATKQLEASLVEIKGRQ